MADIKQLNPPIPINTPKGPATAYMVIDYGIEHDLMWVCAQNESGECWTCPNSYVRFKNNWTLGRIAHAQNPDAQ